MKVKNVLRCIVDSYRKITVEVFDPTTRLIKQRYTIPPHFINHTDIPEDVLESEVNQMVNYYDGLAIIVEGK